MSKELVPYLPINENLSRECKSWIDLRNPEHQAKIVKGCIALYNFGGSSLWIGIDPTTGQPQTVNPPNNAIEMYSVDNIQSLIAKHASLPFAIEIELYDFQGILFPEIRVPSGVRYPCAIRVPLKNDDKTILKEHDVYFRSLNSSKRPASSIAQHNDWDDLVTICFDNREADIGRFLRRQFGGLGSEQLNELLQALGYAKEKVPSLKDQLQVLLDEGDIFYTLASQGKINPDWGSWDTSAIITGQFQQQPLNQSFLDLMYIRNPRHTGRPLWMVSNQGDDRPRVNEGAWQAIINGLQGWGFLDFWRAYQDGRFYLQRPFWEDTQKKTSEKVFDGLLAVDNVAETIITIQSFARAVWL